MAMEVQFLTHAGNYAVVKIPGRAFPGIVFSGDSTMILFREITDILNAIESDPDEAKEACVYLRDELKDILRGYEGALKAYGYDLPYGKSISMQP